jgi:predicted CoA-binding protein
VAADTVTAMTDAERILEAADTVVVVDWPSKDVPDTLARAGFTVLVQGGPEPDHYSAHELSDGEIVVRPVGRPPDHADILYSHRPLEELPGIVAMAQKVGAKAVWCQSGVASGGAGDPKGCWLPEARSHAARTMVESAGLSYVDDTYIADAVRRLGVHK